MDIPDTLPKGQYIVYTLSDPDDHLIYYVGQTCQPQGRLANHLSRWPQRGAKATWMQSLKERGEKPIMQALEVVTGEWVAREREQAWINHFLQQGMPLVNVMEQDLTYFQRAIRPVHQETAIICGCIVQRVWLPDGRTAIILKELLDYFGLSTGSAFYRIHCDPVVSKYVVHIQYNTRGGPQVINALIEGILPHWMAGMKLTRLSAEKRALVEAYQQDSADALCQHFSERARHRDR